MPVTTIKLEGGVFDSKGKMNDLLSKSLEEFEKMLKLEKCQIINVTMGEESKGILGRQQVITVVWMGSSTKIKSAYSAFPKYGIFNTIVSVDFH